jgi:hypothetical protein
LIGTGRILEAFLYVTDNAYVNLVFNNFAKSRVQLII